MEQMLLLLFCIWTKDLGVGEKKAAKLAIDKQEDQDPGLATQDPGN